jgi:hypothetical protein
VSLRSTIETTLAGQVARLTGSHAFQAIESGQASQDDHDRFIEGIVRSHLLSPQLVAFLYALAPPAAAEAMRENLLEELGLEGPGGVAHPALLRRLLEGAGLADRLPQLEAAAAGDVRRVVAEPLLYGTLGELGLAVLGEVVAFEYMLSRVAGRIGRALARHRGLPPAALEWFTHHAGVDLRHAEQGLDALEAYVRYYGIPAEDALAILELTFRDNVFIRRYLGPAGPVPAAGRGAA